MSKISCFRETEFVLKFSLKMIRLYNVLSEFRYLSNPEETKITPEVANKAEEPELAHSTEVIEAEVDPNLGLNKALDTYRKLIEKNMDNALEPLTEKEQSKK